eukprot:834888-Amphidinium_carterae.2
MHSCGNTSSRPAGANVAREMLFIKYVKGNASSRMHPPCNSANSCSQSNCAQNQPMITYSALD